MNPYVMTRRTGFDICGYYEYIILLLNYFLYIITDSDTRANHKMPKRVQEAKKEEILGEDTNRIDREEYKLQSMVSPETHEASRFFDRPPSKEIGNLRVDTMSPAQVSFIQSSTQWHKYFKPSSPVQVPSTIFPDDPVLFPGTKSSKDTGSDSQGVTEGGLESLVNADVPRHHQNNYDSWSSFGSYGDTAGGESYQHQKEYEDTPFLDKSWMNPKSEGKPPEQSSYESFDGKTLAVPEPKQGVMSGLLNHFRSQPLGENAGLGNEGQHSSSLEDQKASLLEKLDELKENQVMPQEGEEKVFFDGGNHKSPLQSDVESPPLLGPSAGLGTALAEELLQKNRGKSQRVEDSTEMLQELRDTAPKFRSQTNELYESPLLARPMFDERASERTLMYNSLNNFDNDRGHMVLIRSHQIQENQKKGFVKDNGINTTVPRKKQTKNDNHKKIHHQKLRNSASKLVNSKNVSVVHRKRLCRGCSLSSRRKKVNGKKTN